MGRSTVTVVAKGERAASTLALQWPQDMSGTESVIMAGSFFRSDMGASRWGKVKGEDAAWVGLDLPLTGSPM